MKEESLGGSSELPLRKWAVLRLSSDPVEAGLGFPGSAGSLPRPQVIHFTFLRGLLAAHTAARSDYMDTKQKGKQDMLLSLKARRSVPSPGHR